MTATTISDRVQRGASLLDTKFPGWVNSVDLSTLNLESSCDCILGQKFGDFTFGARATGLQVETSSVPLGQRSRAQLQEHGFLVNAVYTGPSMWDIEEDEVDRVHQEYVALTKEWAQLITNRRAASQLAEVEEPALATA